MKARAEKNIAFIYVKVGSARSLQALISVCRSRVSCSVSRTKGKKTRIALLTCIKWCLTFLLSSTTSQCFLVYQCTNVDSRTCTWLDLANQLQSDSVGAVINHFIKHKVRFIRSHALNSYRWGSAKQSTTLHQMILPRKLGASSAASFSGNKRECLLVETGHYLHSFIVDRVAQRKAG